MEKLQIQIISDKSLLALHKLSKWLGETLQSDSFVETVKNHGSKITWTQFLSVVVYLTSLRITGDLNIMGIQIVPTCGNLTGKE